uniref:(northern house mosquito) hypothetical protein n=1 Tax=Culex pipiens TaxID=7175 RepID=A0A8D8NHQ0_CULPI
MYSRWNESRCCQIWSCAEARKGPHPGGHAAKHPESRKPTSAGHRTGRPAAASGRCAASPHGDVRVYARKGHLDATTGSRLSFLLHANSGMSLEPGSRASVRAGV